MIGRTLSHFEITGQLGAGGMGEVYLALDTKLERQVALKVLPAEFADDPARLARLQREAKALAALERGYAEDGYERAALLAAEALAASGKTASSRPINVVNFYDDAGDVEKALEWLERLQETKDIAVSYLSVVLVSEELRNHPQFQRLLRSLHLPSDIDGTGPDIRSKVVAPTWRPPP